ncbi:MAG: hypothetical protein ACRDK8_03335, partial [Solirubrobacteraceae bacterium]
EQQLNRAAGLLTAVTAIAAAFQWTSGAAHDHGPTWNGSTGVLIAALAVVSAAAAAVGAGLVSEAFHDQIWRALTGHAAGTAGTLVVITGGAGALAAAASAVLPRTRRRDRPGFVSAGSGGAR